MIVMNGGAGSKGQMASSCSYLLCFYVFNVTPLFKKGGRQKAGNYRPVSLTSVVGKMLESIIKEEIAGHLKKMV